MTHLDHRKLIERYDGFAYDYRMRCDCGQAVVVTAETYFREQFNGARVACDHCGGTVHFGPAVALIRDDNDPALDNSAINSLAWYHTSTWADWPAPSYAAQAATRARQAAERFGLDPTGLVERMSTQALHVGTYEAAIENILRRMRDQSDSESQFYLYRARLAIDPARVNDSYRDENAEEAAQATIADLDAAGLDALRYLNVHEAVGSLSLAIRPACMSGLQRLAIPVAELADAVDEDLVADLEHYEDLGSADNSFLAQLRARRAPGQARPVRLRLPADFEQRATARYLPGVSPVIADAVAGSLGGDGRTAIQRFAKMAALLTRQREVVAMTADQPWRELT